MDSIRKALGAEQINYYGFSYGTYLGQVYATLYPDRVRRMVLDGNVDPRRVWYDANLDQDVAFDRNIKIFFDWIAKYDASTTSAPTGEAVEDTYYADPAELRQAPGRRGDRPGRVDRRLPQAGYYVFGWEDVAAGVRGWVHDGDVGAGQGARTATRPGRAPTTATRSTWRPVHRRAVADQWTQLAARTTGGSRARRRS